MALAEIEQCLNEEMAAELDSLGPNTGKTSEP
jgi:hypothetical protein